MVLEAVRQVAEVQRLKLLLHAKNKKRKAAARKEAILDIKNYEFPEDDIEFSRSVNNFCDDYLECMPGLLVDGDYKKAYKKRAENELKVLKDSNQTHYEKFNELWEEASATMKKKLKIRLIISGIICGVFIIGCGICFAANEGNFFEGAGCGVIFGLIFGLMPQILGKSKSDDE